MEIKGQTAYITGGASGLGEATARILAAAGTKVGVLDMNEELAHSVAAELGGAAAVCDVSDAASHEAAMAHLRDAIGPARIFVACAGIATGAKLVTRDGDATPLDKLTKAIQVNLIGTINSMRLAAADMAAQDPLEDGERGVIVTTSSVAGFEGQVGQGDYSASKGGVAATAITFARELAREGIRVVCISPGLMDTPMMAGLPDEVRQSLIETTVYPKRLGHAEEYGALAKHIAENRYLNGTVIRLDGALRMAPK
jgi:NAD(P)-dependent dehydrogenase (short-subunit alcohol dehydrogenase family)